MRAIFLSLLILFGMGSLHAAATSRISPEEGLTRLQEGNKRFANEQATYCKTSINKRSLLVEGQQPFAVVLGCSDSRAGPEIIFDQGVGDLFVVRVAGNVLGNTELDSIEYAVLHLGASLIVVLGHEKCGAVQAVIESNTEGIPTVASLLAPAIQEARKESKDIWREATIDNVKFTVEKLSKNAALAKLIKDKKLQVVGGFYNLESGAVDLIKN